jgi:hypothetical protein
MSIQDITLFGGLDVSFIVDDLVNACACYVVLNRDLEVKAKSDL